MKKIVAICAAILMTAIVFAQAPNKMSYQAVIRNTANALVANQAVGIRISVLQTSPNGSAVYVETQTPTTNANGLASIEIGGGVVVSGSFSSIDWANGPYFVKTETDPTGGTSYSITATSQLLSVPYALYAQYSSTSSSREIQIFNSSGTFVVPNSVTKVIVEIWGAGGGGGGGGGAQLNQYHAGGGGGGSGGCFRKVILNVTPGQSIVVTVGLGGIGGANGTPLLNGTAGTDGQLSSFGNLIQASGGLKGGGGVSTCNNCGGGAGGNNLCNAFAGNSGGNSSGLGPGFGGIGGNAGGGGGNGGVGGNSQPNQSPPCSVQATSGIIGQDPGGGGGGGGGGAWWCGGNGGSGGNGASGLVIVYW